MDKHRQALRRYKGSTTMQHTLPTTSFSIRGEKDKYNGAHWHTLTKIAHLQPLRQLPSTVAHSHMLTLHGSRILRHDLVPVHVGDMDIRIAPPHL